MVGKTSILHNICGKKCPKDALDNIKSLRASKENIVLAGLSFFQFLCGQKDMLLNQQWFHTFNRMTTKVAVKPHKLSPTAEAVSEHTLRTYLEYHEKSIS